MNLYQKIIEVRKIADGFKKDAKSFNYEYVTSNQILNKIKDKMNEMQLILQPAVIDGSYSEFHYTDKNNKEKIDFVTKGNMTYTWINAENPDERETISWFYYGQQDDISKSFGSALTYSERYYLLKALGLPTDEDDPDAKDTTGKTKQPHSGTNKLSEAQVNRAFAIAKNKGYTSEDVKNWATKKYHVTEIALLTKEQYDEFCVGMEKMDAKNKGA